MNGIKFKRHPNNIDALLELDINVEPFNFQRSLYTDTINNETKCIDRKAHLFWENPVIDAKMNYLMNTLSNSGKAVARLVMTGESKDSRRFFLVKKKEMEQGTQLELSFVDFFFMMYKLQEKIVRIQADIKAYNNIKQYSQNFWCIVGHCCRR